MKCCFCNKKIDPKSSNNPAPYSLSMSIEDGSLRCCSDCNEKIVISARMVCGYHNFLYYDTEKFYKMAEEIVGKGNLRYDFRNNKNYKKFSDYS